MANYHQNKPKSLKQILANHSMFTKNSEISGYYENHLSEEELVYVDEKVEYIKKIIFSVECEAHQMLRNIDLKKNNENQLDLKKRCKWELIVILEYFAYKTI